MPRRRSDNDDDPPRAASRASSVRRGRMSDYMLRDSSEEHLSFQRIHAAHSETDVSRSRKQSYANLQVRDWRIFWLSVFSFSLSVWATACFCFCLSVSASVSLFLLLFICFWFFFCFCFFFSVSASVSLFLLVFPFLLLSVCLFFSVSMPFSLSLSHKESIYFLIFPYFLPLIFEEEKEENPFDYLSNFLLTFLPSSGNAGSSVGAFLPSPRSYSPFTCLNLQVNTLCIPLTRSAPLSWGSLPSAPPLGHHGFLF